MAGGSREFQMRELMLRTLYRWFPFDLHGDCIVPVASDEITISCIINFYGRMDLLQGILHSLAGQKYPRECFEVILVEDQGGTSAGRDIASVFQERLQVVYLPLDKNFGRMGYSRNVGLAHSRGKIVLFLDDDTVIMQLDFLAILERIFNNNINIDAVVPHGRAAYACVEDRYDFHDPYFMTSRCTAYRRSVLAELGGFMGHFIGQEDVEFVIRFIIAGKTPQNVSELMYFHPPLLVPHFRKPKAVGMSFFNLRQRYPAIMWFLILVNCMRHAPLYLLPGRRNREMGRFGIGFMLGIANGFRGGKDVEYN